MNTQVDARELRLDGYIRVSRVGDRTGESFISPAVQRDQLLAYARAHGHQIIDWHVELDQSGGKLDRPRLNVILQRLDRGTSDGIAVARLDRLSRAGVADALTLVEDITSRGKAVIAVDLGLDPTTITGELVMTVLLALARMERRRITKNFAIARSRAIDRGIHITRTVPFGYQRRDDGGLEPHPTNGPLVAEIYQRRADGRTWRSIGEWLRAEGARTAGWGLDRWTLRGLRDIIRNDVYLGIASHGEYTNPNGHKPLVDKALWRRAQRPGAIAQPLGTRPALLGGLLRCGGCRYAMSTHRQRTRGGLTIYHRCRTYDQQGTAGCAEPAHSPAADIDKYVVDAFFTHLPILHARTTDQNPRADRIQAELATARDVRDEWRDDLRAQAAGLDVYMAGLTTRQAEVDRLVDELADVHAAANIGQLPDNVGDLRERWDDLDPLAQRELLASAIQHVFVRRQHRSRSLNAANRIAIVWAGDRDVDIPRRGHSTYVPRPYPFNDDPPARIHLAQDA